MVVLCPAFQQSAAEAAERQRARGRGGRRAACRAEPRRRTGQRRAWLQRPAERGGQRGGESPSWGGSISQRGWGWVEPRASPAGLGLRVRRPWGRR